MLKTASAIIFLLTTGVFVAQNEKTEDWYKESSTNSVYAGISLQEAYEFVDGKEPQKIVVAVIDSGVDVGHEDLARNIWVNEGEIPDNGIDDDNNGYIDDVNGWSFIGGEEGDVEYDLLEFTRIYKKLYLRYKDEVPTSISSSEKTEYARYVKMKGEYESRVRNAKRELVALTETKKIIEICRDILAEDLGKEFGSEDLVGLTYTDERKTAALEVMTSVLNGGLEATIDEAIVDQEAAAEKMYSLDWDPRYIVGDDYENVNERFYGNNHVWGPHGKHGTHVAGIIAADRDNGIGMNGIANAAEIMVLRVVPNGDERDKDVANAIRYAVDNGAKVVNMSFGKSYSPQKAAVDEAVRYAAEKGVLLIHAAGNSSKNIDISNNFPNDKGDAGEISNNWIEVGASSYKSKKELAASFTNYGRVSVDLFAPGHDIYSTTPDDEYEYLSGTSMASPVTAGVAALVWSYNPNLTANQIKTVLMGSVTPFGKQKVIRPGSTKKTKFKKLSSTAGVVNAYQALKLASEMN